ncbi:MAG: hypothetical protein JXB34_13165 [Bacteroidales bacterium]|nr:hypothetical protein [Bacteroidales bacterium]
MHDSVSTIVSPADTNYNTQSDSIYKSTSIDTLASGSYARNEVLSNFNAPVKTGKEIDTSAVIYGWVLDRNFILPEKTDIDTNLPGFHVDNSLFKKYKSVSYLGNTGSAYINNIFFERSFSEDLLFLNSYKHFLSTFDNTVYINTRKPFTRLNYYNAGPKRDKFEDIEIFHSQNINRKFNFGFNVRVLSDRGQYKYLDVKNRTFKTFASYSGNVYNMHANFNLNRYQSSENGGIIDSVYLNQEREYTKAYDVNFKGVDNRSPNVAYVTNKIRYIDAMVSQRVKLFTIGKSDSDSLKASNIAEPMLSHIFIARRTSKLYDDISLSKADYNAVSPLYAYTFVNPVKTYDSIAESRITNKLQLDFKTRFRGKVTVGVFANINHDYIHYSYYSLPDSTIYTAKPGVIKTDTVNNAFYYVKGADTLMYKLFTDRNNNIITSVDNSRNLSNMYISGGIYGKFWTYFQSQFTATVYFSGYKAGQSQIDGEMLTQLNVMSKPYRFLIKGSIENIVPSYQLNNYYSNNYIWEQDFGNYSRVNLSSKIASPSKKFELSANYSLFSNYFYLTDSLPREYTQPLSILCLAGEKEFKFWKFSSLNKIIYQVSENNDIVELPAFIYYHSTYIDHTWRFKVTGGTIQTMLGFDVWYNSYFRGYSYIPAMSVFYQANSETIGGYPYIDFWLNVKLKRTRFFAKYEHANSNWYRKDYYHAISYPAKQRIFKFGISWTFYD